MTLPTPFHRFLMGIVVLGLACLFSSAQAAPPAIVFTTLPAFGTSGTLSGFITNANSATNSVAVYIFVAGAWYSKPGCANPLTSIQPNGSWTADISLYSSDTSATEIAAFLVPSSYTNGCVDGAAGLPVPAPAEATAYANRVDPSARHFNFAGYGWWVKTSTNLAGPGPNYFTASTNNIWLDAQGQLHLKITPTNGVWECAEIISDRSFGYGQYRFTVNSPVSNLGSNAVLGMFSWSYDAAYHYREIDIEQSRWEYGYGPSNVEDYAIDPYAAGQVFNFAVPAGVTNSTHSFIWQSNNVAYQSLNGNFASPPAATNILETWNCAIGVPPAGGEQVHINLWLDNGNPPQNNQPVEAILSSFEFVPLGSPQPAQLGPLTANAGVAQWSVQALANWHYDLFSSSNLLTWLLIGSVAPTNNVFEFTDPNPLDFEPRFYRAITEP